MKRAVLLLLLFCMLYPVAGQNRTKLEYHTQVIPNHGAKLTGVLIHSGDSILRLVPTDHVSKGRLLANATPYTFAVRDVKQLRIRRKGSALKGALFGGGVGLATGAAIGYVNYTPCNTTNTSVWFDCLEITEQKEATIGGGALGAISGAAVGSIIGTTRLRNGIRGDHTVYLLEKDKLLQYVYRE